MRHVSTHRAKPGRVRHIAPPWLGLAPTKIRSYCGALQREFWRGESTEFSEPPDPDDPPLGVCKRCWRKFAQPGTWESNSW